tara:strand:- start:1300 stop:1527 length:228 start_codon:yes stop_codon:yes gene_type:complete
MSEGKLLSDFDDQIKEVQCNRKPVYINRFLAKCLKDFAKANDKDATAIAEYLINLGINSVENNIKECINFDIKNL